MLYYTHTHILATARTEKQFLLTADLCSCFVLQQGITSLANVQVRDAMFSAIFHKLQGQFPTFSIAQYKDWFQNKLSLWLGSINASALAAIPRNIPCSIYQIM